MSTIEVTKTATQVPSHPAADNKTVRVFLTRGIIAIAWAAAFAASSTLTAGLTVGVGILLVLYPLIDAVASLIDAGSQHGSARRTLLVNAASSTAAAIALGVAATAGAGAVLTVFGVWAVVSGAAQFITAIRRRHLLGLQLPMLLAGGVSVLLGIGFVLSAAAGHPMVNMLAIYAATGGIDFIIEAGLIVRRRRRLADPAHLSPSES
jgi:uncharacterized membrane protein HdeD (DUF308 family)